MLVLVVGGGAGVVAAGAVDQNVAGTQIGQNRLVDGLQRVGVQYVGLVAFAHEALGFQLVGQLLNGLFVQIQRGDLCTGLSERACHSAADDAAGTGDDHDFAGKINVQGKIHHNKIPPDEIYWKGLQKYP